MSQQTVGYCWRTQKCRNFCLTHAFLEGQEAWGGLLKKPQSRSIEVGSPTVSGGILLANPKMEQFPCRTRSLEVEGARNMPMHKRWAMALKYTPNEFANSIRSFFETE
jgi:hypothetical protein